MPSTKIQNFHLPLPADVYAELRREAQLAGLPATVVAREALEAWLRQRKRAQLQSELQAYVAATAGSRDDLDEKLAAASATFLAEGDDR